MSREQERTALHRAIWQIANDLRGAVDGWDFKSYVLGMLFYRFISENLTAYINKEERRAGNAGFDYVVLSDAKAKLGKTETIREKRFYILPSELFANVQSQAKNDPNLNETLSKVFNMFLHDVNFEKFDIAHGDTLVDPKHWDEEPFDAIVSNPPYSIKWDGDANPLLMNDPRFSPAGVLAPKSKADLAFTMHMLSLCGTGRYARSC